MILLEKCVFAAPRHPVRRGNYAPLTLLLTAVVMLLYILIGYMFISAFSAQSLTKSTINS
ncbi:MAG: hypothetical protein DYG88_01885 [Chloroflexi bacterium CFX4]|nr:hypothetical protein [Chloroflexi bacterium CFX4]